MSHKDCTYWHSKLQGGYYDGEMPCVSCFLYTQSRETYAKTAKILTKKQKRFLAQDLLLSQQNDLSSILSWQWHVNYMEIRTVAIQMLKMGGKKRCKRDNIITK